MERQIHHKALSDLGLQRDNNEDNYIEWQGDHSTLLLGAIDGVGGYAGGEVAAALCREHIEAGFETLAESEEPERHLGELMLGANELIRQQQREQAGLERMGCVASVALLDSQRERLYFAHVGDSRGYVLREGKLHKFTHDHSFVGYMEEQGQISEAEAMNHSRRNEISRMLGQQDLSTVDGYIETGVYSFYPQDIVLFCSDGLSDLVPSAEIIQILQADLSLEERAEALVARANSYGGKDNITVALAYYNAETATSLAEGDAELDKEGTASNDLKMEIASHKDGIWGRLCTFIFGTWYGRGLLLCTLCTLALIVHHIGRYLCGQSDTNRADVELSSVEDSRSSNTIVPLTNEQELDEIETTVLDKDHEIETLKQRISLLNQKYEELEKKYNELLLHSLVFKPTGIRKQQLSQE